LEKARRPLRAQQSTIEDVSRFLRHTRELTDAQKISYLKSYFQTDNFTPAQTKLIGKMRGAPKI
jgi:hypothetical protein